MWNDIYFWNLLYLTLLDNYQFIYYLIKFYIRIEYVICCNFVSRGTDFSCFGKMFHVEHAFAVLVKMFYVEQGSINFSMFHIEYFLIDLVSLFGVSLL